MIVIEFFSNNEFINYFKIKGHSKQARRGEDVICSAVSSVSTTMLNGILEVVKVDVLYEMKDGLMICDMRDKQLTDLEMIEINVLLKSMYLYFEELARVYPDNVKVKLVEVKK